MYPAFVRAPLRGFSCALRQLALLLRLRRPAGYGFPPNLVRKERRKDFSGASANAELRHLGAWPTRFMVPRSRSGNSTNGDNHVPEQSNPHRLPRQQRRSSHQQPGLQRHHPSLATKSSYKKDGKYISHTEWHRCVVFGKLSEFAKTLTKGAHIQVEGELRSREYDSKKTDSKRRVWEIRVASILKLDRAEKRPGRPAGRSAARESPQEETAA